MNFEFSADQKLLGEQARKFLADNCASTEVRKILEGSDAYHHDLWHGIAELGWLGTAIPEAYGLGAGYVRLLCWPKNWGGHSLQYRFLFDLSCGRSPLWENRRTENQRGCTLRQSERLGRLRMAGAAEVVAGDQRCSCHVSVAP